MKDRWQIHDAPFPLWHPPTKANPPSPSRAVSFVSPVRKIKTGQPTFFFRCCFSLIAPPPTLFSFLHIGPSLSVYLSSSLPPTLPGHCTGQDGSHDTLWDVSPPPPRSSSFSRHSSVIASHKWQLPLPTHTFTSAFLVEDNVLCACGADTSARPLKVIGNDSWRYYAWCLCTDPVMGGKACLLVILCCWWFIV